MATKRQLACLLAGVFFLCAQAWAAQKPPPVTLMANSITYDAATGLSVAEGNVVISQEDGEARAARAEYDLNSRSGFLEGGVSAQKGDAMLLADKLIVRESGHLTAVGSASVGNVEGSVAAPRIDYWSESGLARTSGGWGRLSQPDGSLLTAVYIVYDLKKGSGVAENNVRLESPVRRLTGGGDKATYEGGASPGEIILTGNAWLVQDGNKIMGDSLTIHAADNTGAARGQARMEISPAKKEEEVSTEKTAEEAFPEKTAEETAPEKKAEEIAPEKTAGEIFPEEKEWEIFP